MKLRRWQPRWYLGLALLFVAAGLGGWTWAVLTPEIGVPYQPTDGRDSRSLAADGSGNKLWSFGFVGDTHAGLGNATVDELFAKFAAGNVEFVLHLGDLVDVGAADQQWDEFARLAHQHRLRLMPVVGNHDVHRGYSQDRGEIRWRQYFPQLPETFYSFSHRGLNFVMLNSERILSPGSQQADFLARQLRAEPGTTIVCLHRPVYTCGRRDLPFVMARRLWLHPRLQQTGAVCVLTGHNHYYERTKPLDGVTYLVTGGGAPNQYDAETPNARTERFVSGRPHYGLVDVHAGHLAVRILDLEGTVLDEFALPRRAEHAREPRRDQLDRWGREIPPREQLGAQEALRGESPQVASRPLPALW